MAEQVTILTKMMEREQDEITDEDKRRVDEFVVALRTTVPERLGQMVQGLKYLGVNTSCSVAGSAIFEYIVKSLLGG